MPYVTLLHLSPPAVSYLCTGYYRGSSTEYPSSLQSLRQMVDAQSFVMDELVSYDTDLYYLLMWKVELEGPEFRERFVVEVMKDLDDCYDTATSDKGQEGDYYHASKRLKGVYDDVTSLLDAMKDGGKVFDVFFTDINGTRHLSVEVSCC